MNDADLHLLLELSADDAAREAEWLRVFRHFNPRLRSYFRSRFGSSEDLEDHLAEIWRRAVLNIHALSNSSALWPWLVAVGNNRLRDVWRKNGQTPTHLSLDCAAEHADVLLFLSSWHTIPDSLTAVELASVLAKLSPEEQGLINLLVHGYSHSEIATALKLPSAATSRQRLHRIREHLNSTMPERRLMPHQHDKSVPGGDS
ncbi:MAG: sigma-70 family RNA polymerase sigma factor [Thioalkalivibrio sp.]|nr:sigma-70 family RNA polymerase sigma factor [Thioalkalivibrio sp.]